MHMHRIGATAHKARSVWVLIAGLGFSTVLGVGPASAQTPATPAANADGAPSEALRRQAASPYRFILQNASAPARKPAAPAPAAPEPRRPAAAAPIEQAAVQPRAAPVTAAPAAIEPPPTPVATLMPKPPEPAPIAAVRREIIPVRTDEPRLPAALLRERPSGVVKVQFDVNPDGSTGGVKVLSSSNRALNRVTVDAVAAWKFQPVDEVLTVETELAYKFE